MKSESDSENVFKKTETHLRAINLTPLLVVSQRRSQVVYFKGCSSGLFYGSDNQQGIKNYRSFFLVRRLIYLL